MVALAQPVNPAHYARGPTNAAAVETLVELGAHFVLCSEDKDKDKEPRLGHSWKQPASADSALAWLGTGGRVGVVPASVGCAVVDVDVDADQGGDEAADAIVEALGQPVVRVGSKTPGHWHLWYPCGERPPKKHRWHFRNMHGDLICQSAYVVLWELCAVADQLGRNVGTVVPPTGPLRVAMTKEGGRNDTLYDVASEDPELSGRRGAYELAGAIAGLSHTEVSRTLDSAADSERQRGRDLPDMTAWQEIAKHCAERLRRRFRFEQERFCWYEWTDACRWTEVTDERAITDALHNDRLRIAADLGDSGHAALRTAMMTEREWRTLTNQTRSEWWAALRSNLARPPLSSPRHEFATPEGVVDLRTGNIEPHDPLKHDTVAVTKGRYRPREARHLRQVLWDRLRHNMTKVDYVQLVKTLGVAVARRNADFAGVLWLYGASGGGKGFTAAMIEVALGGQAAGVSASLLERRTGDIDADLADILERDPAVVISTEVKSVSADRINALTGGDTFSARRPYGKTIRRALSGMLIVTSVDAPHVAIQTGLRRRLIVVDFPKKLAEDVAKDRKYSSDELDAVVTLAIIHAYYVGRRGWVPPTGNVEAKRRFEEQADPITVWLDNLSQDAAGTPVADLLTRYNDEAGEDVSKTLFGRRINTNTNWQKERRSGKVVLKRAQLHS